MRMFGFFNLLAWTWLVLNFSLCLFYARFEHDQALPSTDRARRGDDDRRRAPPLHFRSDDRLSPPQACSSAALIVRLAVRPTVPGSLWHSIPSLVVNKRLLIDRALRGS